MEFGNAEFRGGEINFRSAKWSGDTTLFSGAKFCGSEVDFSSSKFSSGTIDLSDAADWSYPPKFGGEPPSTVVKLPKADHDRFR